MQDSRELNVPNEISGFHQLGGMRQFPGLSPNPNNIQINQIVHDADDNDPGSFEIIGNAGEIGDDDDGAGQ